MYRLKSIDEVVSDKKFDELRRICLRRQYGEIGITKFYRLMRLHGYTRRLAHLVCYDIMNYNYEYIPEEVEWCKVLAVLTSSYKGSRHLEARMVIDIPCEVYSEDFDDFKEFCEWILRRYFEIKGYETYLDSSRVYFGIEVIERFFDKIDKDIVLYIELFDYDYMRYPFEDEVEMPDEYWEDYIEAREYLSQV